MRPIEIVAVALGLAMDAFAVSIASGATIKRVKLSQAMRIGLFFGGFQALMPLVGWLAGRGLRDLISGYDHWVAFALLAAIGCKMIYESLRLKRDEKTFDPLNVYVLLVLAVATSLDALAVGVSLSFLKVSIVSPAIVIGAVTFAVCLAGVYIGERFGHWFESRIEAAGGVVLILIGVKILVEHLSA